jgi:hypothetical protein
MDYTQSPRSNLEPGQHNYDLLQELYGTAEGNTTTGGLRGRANLEEDALDEDSDIPNIVMEKYKIAAQTAATSVGHTDYIDLGDGYAIVFHKLSVAQ